MTGFQREASLEAISSGIAPRIVAWVGREQRRIPWDEAASALVGIEQPAYAALLWSLGHHEPEHAAVLVCYLRTQWAGEPWPRRRLDAMISLCIGELSDGYALDESQRLSEPARAAWCGMSRPRWYACWRARYTAMMRSALDLVAQAQQALGRRVIEE